MKKFYLFAAAFFLAGVFSANAQDIIVLRDGNIIEAKVTEISQTEIRYKRFDNQDGPVIVIDRGTVLSIRYENGIMENLNDSPTPAAAPTPAPAIPVAAIPAAEGPKPNTPAMDPEKLTFSLSLEPAGFLAGGPSASGEWTKHKLNIQFHISFPTLVLNSPASGFGFGLGVGLNYFLHTRVGGFYVGGMFEWNISPYSYTDSYWHPYYTYNPSTDTFSGQEVFEEKDSYMHDFIIALNIGYKFVTPSGIYFRTGVSAGGKLSNVNDAAFFYRPDLATGYTF